MGPDSHWLLALNQEFFASIGPFHLILRTLARRPYEDDNVNQQGFAPPTTVPW